MKKQNLILSAALVAVFSASTAFAEAEVTGKIVHESAKFTTSGQGIGATTTWNQTADSHGKDVMKTETSARIYIDGEADTLQEGATYHVELNLMRDSKGVDKYDGNESYTQRDALREAYVDAEVNDYSIRVGKQQVVWGTADGMKLLDTINPTDYSEMAQNQMEDSRIPVWMLNAEKDLETGGSAQFIISEAKTNKIAGLSIASGKATTHTNGNAGNAFIMKGVDSISGKVNGFMNVAPALGKVAAFFTAAASGAGVNDAYSANLYNMYKGATVSEFVNISGTEGDGGDFAGLTVTGCNGTTSAHCLYNTANSSATTSGFTTNAMGGNNDVTNLIDASDSADTAANWSTDNPNSAFEYMGETSFASFYNFVNMTSEYRVEHEDKPTIALRFKDSTPSGLNYSLNFMDHEDANPYVNSHFEDQNGVQLTTTYVSETPSGSADGNCGQQACTAEKGTTIQLQSGGSQFVPTATNQANLVMVEKTNRIQSLGGSFDTAVETANLGPVVLRGEFLYDKGVMTPIVDLAKLSIGDMTGGLVTEEADMFKYVLGADITALTNMMVSAQIIQIRNLDFVDTTHTPTVGDTSHVSGARYTGDAATMHMTNGFNKAEENKEFYSLFLSKPFGASAEHRWNNIFMFEENGGKWNRLDAEFSIDDDTQATVEYNKYWGDANTQFGQLEKSSNVQVGFKYSF